MSTRLGLRGFRLDRMRSLFGSGDQAVIDAIEARLDRAVAYENAPDGMFNRAFCDDFRRALQLAVNVGVPLPGLKTEGYPHVFLADWLAGYRQQHVITNCDYKYYDLISLLDEYGRFLPSPAGELFAHLVEGRPLFGGGFGSTEPYGYLTFVEAGQLQSCLQATVGTRPDDDVFEEIVSDFAGFLGEIRSKKRDVWATVH